MEEAKANDCWYTPPVVLEAVTAFLGKGWYDPCPANPRHSGLLDTWGTACFINPPYSNPLRRLFVLKGATEWKPGDTYLWLLNYANNQDVEWLVGGASAVCLPHKRIRFVPGHADLGDGSSPRYDSIFILWGRPDGFADAFNHLGGVFVK